MDAKIRQYFIRLIYITIDLMFICLSVYFAFEIMQVKLSFKVTPYSMLFSEHNPYQFIVLFWVTITILFLYSKNLYQTKREILEGVEIVLVVKSVVYAMCVVIITVYSTKSTYFPRSIILLGSAMSMTFLSVWRVFKRKFVKYLVANGYNNFNVLIIGAGKVGTALSKEIQHKPELGLKVVGYLDDFKKEPLEKKGPKVLGTLADFPKVARNEFVNKVFICLHLDSDKFLKLLVQAKKLDVALRVVPHGFELLTTDFHKFNIGLIPIIEYSEEENITKQAGKRLFDLVFSSLAIIILSPLFLLLPIIIKLNSPGPVFYFSRRYGRGGRKFNMFKFRSMVKEADKILDDVKDQNEVDGPIFKIKNDPRITRLGHFLRKYSLDELPQLFNVLIGDMSLVGPRPLPVEQIEKEDIRQLKRLEVRPGITGLWQIRGRSDISFGRLVKWDVWYINNWSFWLDVNILWQTIPVVVKAKGAY